MAITLDETLQGENANSYCDVPYADDYFATIANTAKRTTWTAATDPQKTLALIQACKMIDRLKMTEPLYGNMHPPLLGRMQWGTHWPKFEGVVYPATFTQKLQLPRNIDIQNDGTYLIPEEAQMAQCEQAVFLINFDDSDLVAQRQGKTHEIISADAVRISTSYSGFGDAYSPMAVSLLGGLLIHNKRRDRS